jgi:hypothetical protein
MKDTKILDVTDGLTQAILEQIPVVNFFTSAVVNIKENCLQRRFENWQVLVGERLSNLEKEVFDTLGDNETFATTLLRTTELASKSNAKKMEMLANAVKYVATNEINDDYLIIFLNCIDKYTIPHIRMLKYFSNPRNYYTDTLQYFTVQPKSLYLKTYSLSEDEEMLLDNIADVLCSDGLLGVNDLTVLMQQDDALAKHTTKMGDKFIEFFGILDIEL